MSADSSSDRDEGALSADGVSSVASVEDATKAGEAALVAAASGEAAGAADSGEESFRYEIELTDQELATAWVREHYARQGSLRFWMAPALLFFGVVVLAQAPNNLPRLAAFLMLAWGAFSLIKPFLMASQVVAQRRKRGGTRAVIVHLDESGLSIAKAEPPDSLTAPGKVIVFPWKDITAAGVRQDYVWYEIRGAQRAPIPKRVITNLDALQRYLSQHTRWTKR